MKTRLLLIPFLLTGSFAFAGSLKSKCEGPVLNEIRKSETFYQTDLRGSFKVKAGEPLIVEADMWETNLDVDSVAVLVEKHYMGDVMSVVVSLVDPSTCQVLKRFNVPAGY